MFNGPENNRVGGGYAGSYLHPVVMIMLLVAIGLMLFLPRKYVVVPFLLAVFMTPFGQQINVAGAHLFVGRFLVLCGWIRISLTKSTSNVEIASGGFTVIDKVFLLWAIFRASATILVYLQVPAVVNQVGFLWDSIGGYFLFRFLIRDEEDIVRLIKSFAFVVSILALTMTYERLHEQNIFGYMGGQMAPYVRDGAIRAQGTFEGPIPAGTFGATLFCLFAWLWWSGRSRSIGIAGMIGVTVMVVASASSTPLMTCAAVMLAISIWPLRKNMRMLRWGIVIGLVSLHLVMKAPVWMLIAHVDLVGGNSSYHRAMLVDQFIRHFSDWCLIGVKSTQGWGWDMWDQANQFTAEGTTGGLATFICFVLLISRSFGRLGHARKVAQGDRKKEWLFWLLGSTLFSYVVSFFGISFSDQSVHAWYALLATICAATAPLLGRKRHRITDGAAYRPQKPQFAYSSLADPESLA